MTKNNEIESLKFEEAILRLEQIVDDLSSKKVALDSMITMYQEGQALRKHCSKLLEEAKLKIDLVEK